jgi:FkbM family methyltransferase
MGSLVRAQLRTLGYRRYILKRTLAVACNRLNLLTRYEARPNRVINGTKMRFRLHDYTACLFYFGTSSEPENAALLGAIGEEAGGDLIDVGANYGQLAYELRGRFRTMLLFEPNPDAASFLRTLFAQQGDVAIVEAGAADIERNAVLSIPHRQSGLANVNSDGDGPPIKLTRIDEVIRLRPLDPCVIKIDVEGFEEKVLRGAQQTIDKHLPILAWEARDNDHFLVCKRVLSSSWNFYRIDSLVTHGLKGLHKVATVSRSLLTGSQTYVTQVHEVFGPISLVFGVHPERERMFSNALERLRVSGVRF